MAKIVVIPNHVKIVGKLSDARLAMDDTDLLASLLTEWNGAMAKYGTVLNGDLTRSYDKESKIYLIEGDTVAG